MAKFSTAVDEALSVVAHVVMAREMSTNVKGMEAFAAYYIEQLSPRELAIWKRLQQLHMQAFRDLSEQIQQLGANGR